MATPETLLEIPPLESGDRLSRDEFHRRYEVSSRVKKAELVDGVVYVASPVRIEHSGAHGAVVGWLAYYAAPRTGVELHVEPTLLLEGDNEVQPDVLLRRVSGGTSGLMPDRFIEGPPELIVEVAGSSASYDLHSKLRLYERSCVAEYVVWQVYDRKIRWFRLQDGKYVEQSPDDDGFIESQMFPGLRLAPDALLAGDLAAVLEALR